MEAKLRRFFELRDSMKTMKDEQDQIKVELKAMVGTTRMDVYLEDMKVRLQHKTRQNRRCDWNIFKASHEELYNELVIESTSDFLDVRQVVNS